MVHFNTKHGYKKHPIYDRHKQMLYRCYNPSNKEYKNYGLRGIDVCVLWWDVSNFILDMEDSYYEHVRLFGLKQTTLDRIDNNKGYNKVNCKWSTLDEQVINRRVMKWFKASNGILTVTSNNQQELCNNYGLNKSCVSMCLSGRRKHTKGWTFEYL